MRYNMFELSGRCVISLNKTEHAYDFYCDGFDALTALHELPDLGNIKVEDLYLETQQPAAYTGTQLSDFAPINTFAELLEIIDQENMTADDDIFIHNLSFTSKDTGIVVDDDRHMWVSLEDATAFEELTRKLLGSFKFKPRLIDNILMYAKEHPGTYIVVNNHGYITGKYKDRAEYWKREKEYGK